MTRAAPVPGPVAERFRLPNPTESDAILSDALAPAYLIRAAFTVPGLAWLGLMPLLAARLAPPHTPSTAAAAASIAADFGAAAQIVAAVAYDGALPARLLDAEWKLQAAAFPVRWKPAPTVLGAAARHGVLSVLTLAHEIAPFGSRPSRMKAAIAAGAELHQAILAAGWPGNGPGTDPAPGRALARAEASFAHHLRGWTLLVPALPVAAPWTGNA
jgi:hypothetical protein